MWQATTLVIAGLQRRHHRRVVLARPWLGRASPDTPALSSQGRDRAARPVHAMVGAIRPFRPPGS